MCSSDLFPSHDITHDGDLQNDPSDIPAMVELLENGNYDLVVGKRQKRKDSSIKRLLPEKGFSEKRNTTKQC